MCFVSSSSSSSLIVLYHKLSETTGCEGRRRRRRGGKTALEIEDRRKRHQPTDNDEPADNMWRLLLFGFFSGLGTLHSTHIPASRAECLRIPRQLGSVKECGMTEDDDAIDESTRFNQSSGSRSKSPELTLMISLLAGWDGCCLSLPFVAVSWWVDAYQGPVFIHLIDLI